MILDTPNRKSQPSEKTSNHPQRFFKFAALLAILLMTFRLLALYLLPGPTPYVFDDSFMFVRYADNLIHEGRIAWNPRGEPTYGLTSPLYLLVIIPLRLIFTHNPVLTVTLSSSISGLIFLILLGFLLHRHIRAGNTVKWLSIAFVFWSLALARESLLLHFLTGMDTLFALAYITVFIYLSKQQEKNPGQASTLIISIFGGFAYFIRPDLLLYTLLVPVFQILCAKDKQQRNMGWLSLATMIGLTVIQMTAAFLYFHTPVPLPFYAKALRSYQNFDTTRYRAVPFMRLYEFCYYYRFLFIVIGFDLMLNFKRRVREISSVEKALFVSTGLYLLYFTFGVLQIMSFFQRFYYPALPAIVMLAAQSFVSIANSIPSSLKEAVKRTHRNHWRLASLLLLALLIPDTKSRNLWLDIQSHERRIDRLNTKDEYSSRAFNRLFWRDLDRFSTLPDDLVIATTEVGHPAEFNPHKTVIDLAGLNETDFALHPFTPERLFAKYQPDLFYMPHPDYRGMNASLLNYPRLLQEYELFPARGRQDSELAIALWRKSRYYLQMRQIVLEGERTRSKSNGSAGSD